mgnify:CR=1 FL=1
MKPATMTVQAACNYSGLCRATIYNLMNENKLESVKVLRRRLIKTASLDALLDVDQLQAA